MDRLGKCEDINELLVFYRFGELTPDKKAMIEEHLGGCEGCRASLAELDLTLELSRPEPVTNATAQAASTGVMERIGKRAARPLILRLAPVLAALAILVGGATLYFTGYVGTQQQPKQVQQVASASDVDAGLLENYDLLANMDVLEDMDTLENMADL